jgi:hypothetical protein
VTFDSLRSQAEEVAKSTVEAKERKRPTALGSQSEASGSVRNAAVGRIAADVSSVTFTSTST